MSTVAAISTPLFAGGISVIRISGPKSLEIADKIFVSFRKNKPSDMEGYTCEYGKIVRDTKTLDDVVLTVFKAPKSFTGEDTVEISCHGGIFVTKEILRLILENGAEPASPGEFTKRAFLNGKFSLTQAEGIADIISAEGEASLSSARLMKEGKLFKTVSEISKSLVSVLGSLAAWTDYPDEDIPETDNGTIQQSLQNSLDKLIKILNDYDKGRIFREGIDTAIVGRPNVGKSTLMNQILGYERSIVTTVAGTTRDIIEESARVGNVVLKLSDTAGMRETEDEVEGIGVVLAKRKLEEAELVIAVIDGSQELTSEDKEMLESIKQKRHIVVVNKSDLPQKLNKEYINSKNILEVSAKLGNGMEILSEKINEIFELGGNTDSSMLFANERQRTLCEKAKEFLEQALNASYCGETLDAVTVCVEKAADLLLALSGEKATEEVVNDVFSRFCVGK